MSSSKGVTFPNELLERMDIETTIFSPGNEAIGVAALSEIDGDIHVLRLYQLVLEAEGIHITPSRN